jgi:hypothetical protein
MGLPCATANHPRSLAQPISIPFTSTTPTNTGNNLDNRRLGKGATLYLPVKVYGGLLQMGDCHAAQVRRGGLPRGRKWMCAGGVAAGFKQQLVTCGVRPADVLMKNVHVMLQL